MMVETMPRWVVRNDVVKKKIQMRAVRLSRRLTLACGVELGFSHVLSPGPASSLGSLGAGLCAPTAVGASIQYLGLVERSA